VIVNSMAVPAFISETVHINVQAIFIDTVDDLTLSVRVPVDNETALGK